MNLRTADRIISILIMAGSFLLLRQLKGVPREGYIFPSVLLYAMIGFSVMVFSRTLLKGQQEKKLALFAEVPFGRWATVVIIFVLYVFGMFHLGFFVSTLVAATAITTVLSGDRWKQALPVNVVFSLSLVFVFYLFFVQLMKVRFPDALLM